MGRVLDGASPGPCKVLQSNGKDLVFRPGVVGALDSGQVEALCTERKAIDSKTFRQASGKFSLLGKISGKCMRRDVPEAGFLECVISEASKLKGGKRPAKRSE